MTSPTLVSVEDYLRRSEKPNCEYEDGVLNPKAMPTKPHSLIQHQLVVALRKAGLDALQEVTVRLGANQFLVPDVVAATHLASPYPTEPVLLCVEILSPEDRVGAMLAKCEKYHAWGVPFCWVVDPEKQTAWEYHKGGEPVPLARDGVLKAGEIGLRLDELFSALSP